MSEGLFVAMAFLVLLVVLPAMVALVLERLRASRPKDGMLLNADHARARATLVYYIEVHSG